MKNFELGDKVFVEKYYIRNNRTVFDRNENCKRYNLKDLNLSGVYAGKRVINFKGYTEYIGYEEGFAFVPIEKLQVHLVAISHKQLIYVPDEFIRRE